MEVSKPFFIIIIIFVIIIIIIVVVVIIIIKASERGKIWWINDAQVICRMSWGYATLASVSTWMGGRIYMSISVDRPSDKTLNRGPLVLLLR